MKYVMQLNEAREKNKREEAEQLGIVDGSMKDKTEDPSEKEPVKQEEDNKETEVKKEEKLVSKISKTKKQPLKSKKSSTSTKTNSKTKDSSVVLDSKPKAVNKATKTTKKEQLKIEE